MSHTKFSYSQVANVELFEQLYASYLADPLSIDQSWRFFFDGLEFASEKKPFSKAQLQDGLRVFSLIQAYRTYGYLKAQVNPIATSELKPIRELSIESYGLNVNELENLFPTFGILNQEEAPLKEIIHTLEAIYCSKIGIEYAGIQNPELQAWIQKRIEPILGKNDLTMDEKKMTLQLLNQSELFEIFLHTKFVGQKRFSLEGCETLIPMLEEILEQGAELGMNECYIGMAHRGRLNVLVNILKKSYSMVLTEFEKDYVPELMGSGDVKYHNGFSSDITTPKGKQVHVVLAANPSHLESVNPVVEGQCRAKQMMKEDGEKLKVLPIIIHGDSAISGQGVVYETMQLCALEGYSTGGTLHLVINNQIGFTTIPEDSRSTRDCTDIAHAFNCPVFHVNAEDPESCIFATHVAIEIRQKFHCDVFIDLNCYRKYGHNEGDEPAYTQPLEYMLIRKKRSIREVYRDQLIKEGFLEKQLAESLESDFKKNLQKELDEIQKAKKEQAPFDPAAFSATDYFPAFPRELFEAVNTGVDVEVLRQLAKKFSEIPEGFNLHKKIQSLITDRLKMLEGSLEEKKIDWGMAETLAYASLLNEGTHIRISGQDSRRGTFSHRHAVWIDQATATKYFPLQHVATKPGHFDIFNSPLSELAVLGFEYGYSVTYPNSLVIWEAQYGDFCNGAQVIIDQYLTTAEQKWGVSSGLTLFLPHGYEGDGPEHSSARIERFIQLAGDSNIQVVNPTTPSQFFHLLRRQVHRSIKKPLIVLTPKGLLRNPKCLSSLNEISKGSFEEILDDPEKDENAKKLIFCSGRIYYDLMNEREKRKATGYAFIRIEQLYPLDLAKLEKVIKSYDSFQECVWVQEEPSNMGTWEFIRHLLEQLTGKKLQYIGRRRSASPAAGSHALHHRQHSAIINQVFS